MGAGWLFGWASGFGFHWGFPAVRMMVGGLGGLLVSVLRAVCMMRIC